MQLFDGGMGVPLVVPAPVRPGSSVWDEAVDTARRVAGDLDLELAVATSSGWSASGGPWVRPDDAMKKVVWSVLAVDGGDVAVSLPPLPDTVGLYQDSPRWDAISDGRTFATEWRVLAFPAGPTHDALRPDGFAASAVIGDWSGLTDGSFTGGIELPRDPDASSTAWIEQCFDGPVTVRSVVVGLPGPHGFGAAPAADALLYVSDDGVDYRHVVTLPPTTSPARTASIPPVRARRFRLVLSAQSAAEALPPVGDGVRLPPVLRRAPTFLVTQFALRAAQRVHHAEAKAGFATVPDYYAVDTTAVDDVGAVDVDSVVDVTPHVHEGVLRWSAPPGTWIVLRLGASLTGQTNGPAPAESTGLEVDKLDGRRVQDYLATYLERFGDTTAHTSPDRISALLSDSIEAGPQNFTDAMLEHFERLRGYDATPWLPALAGFVVGDASKSDRFLYDYRRTIADLLSEQYYGTVAAVAHERGMIHYAEALEDGRPQLGDDLTMRSHADVPMGAMWTFDPTAGPRGTYVADLKGASSVAHVYGRRWTGAEAFTSFGAPWSSTPRSLKHVADLQLALGVTRFCIHTSPHQPLTTSAPGIALAPFLGQAFTVHETWADMARPWIDYLGRCSAILSAGVPATDVAVFVGEEAPVTGLFEHTADASMPDGFDYDYVGFDALATILEVDDEGRVTSRGGSYRLLYLGGTSRRMTLSALSHVERLLEAGATVVGLRPDSSPSLADDPADFASVCHRIWGRRERRGRLIASGDLAAALADLSIQPAIRIVDVPVRQVARIVDGRRVTFLANPSAEPVEASLLVDAALLPLAVWDPVAVREARLSSEPVSGDCARVSLSLPGFGSLFVLSNTVASASALRETSIVPAGRWTLQVGALPLHPMPDGPQLWTDAIPDARGFSGTGTYRTTVDLDIPTDAARVEIDLGDVRDIARVTLNGFECGIAWTPPFRVDATHAARSGLNTIEVHVANPWRNRLIAEATAPSGAIFEPMTKVFEPDAEPLPAGLAGPVRVIVSR